jgi:hypothetical protein
MRARVIVVICTVLVTFLCCQKEDSHIYKSDGLITGPDIRMCACCGGYYIQIDSITYEFDTLPDNSGIDLQSTSFPLNVKLDWQLSDKVACPATRITISRIKKE